MCDVRLGDLITSLRSVVLQASRLARACRSDEQLFALLVEEKGADANTRFQHDFKTLVDVLVQVCVAHVLEARFPGLVVHGEEDGLIGGVEVKLGVDEEATAEMLARALRGAIGQDEDVASGKVDLKLAAKTLARLAHDLPDGTLHVGSIEAEKIAQLNEMRPVRSDKIALWVDPIDGTNQFIAGKHEDGSISGIAKAGLECVTVLVGSFLVDSGEPLAGVVGQPFAAQNSDCFTPDGLLVWGARSIAHVPTREIERDRGERSIGVTISGSESERVRALLVEHAEAKLCVSSGAGYKTLAVILGHAQAFVLTRASTYAWDTCAPHAVMRALGGDMWTADTESEVLLHNRVDHPKNARGVVACLDGSVHATVRSALSHQ